VSHYDSYFTFSGIRSQHRRGISIAFEQQQSAQSLALLRWNLLAAFPTSLLKKQQMLPIGTWLELPKADYTLFSFSSRTSNGRRGEKYRISGQPFTQDVLTVLSFLQAMLPSVRSFSFARKFDIYLWKILIKKLTSLPPPEYPWHPLQILICAKRKNKSIVKIIDIPTVSWHLKTCRRF